MFASQEAKFGVMDGLAFNAMERKNANMAIETNVKKTMIKIKSNGG
jgi:hypothetical protein